jgi:hypothetical protein
MLLGRKTRWLLTLLGLAWFGGETAYARGFLRHCIHWPSMRWDCGQLIVGEQPWAGNLAPWWTYFPYDPNIVNPPVSVYPTWPSQFPPAQAAERIASPQMAPRFPPNPTPMPTYAPANPRTAFPGGGLQNFYFDR